MPFFFPLKVAVVGCGAVGSYYGAQLARDGHDVHFLLRSDYEVVRRSGVQIKSPKGDFRVRPRAARSPDAIGRSDLIIVALKTTANQVFGELLPPLADSSTAVLTLQNGLGNEEALAKLFAPPQILGGLCFVCLNRVESGVIQHFDHGTVVLGEFQGWPEPRTHDIAGAFRHAGVPCEVTPNLAHSRWEKLTWNIPFNGLGVASAAGYDALQSGELSPNTPLLPCLITDRILADPCWFRTLRELLLEVVAGARALGFNLEESLFETQVDRTRTMGPYRPSTVIDFEHGMPVELNSMFLEPLRRASHAGAAMPVLRRLCEVLQQLDRKRAGLNELAT